VSDFRVPRQATVDLTGRTVLEVVPRGKHLRMQGAWRTFAAGEPARGGPDWQIRVVLGNEWHVAVGYRLPVLDILPTADESTVVGHLGPDVLGPDWDPDRVMAGSLARPERELGTVLLDQTVLAGLGNVYRIEACFVAGAAVGVCPRSAAVASVRYGHPYGRAGTVGRLRGRARHLLVPALPMRAGASGPAESVWPAV